MLDLNEIQQAVRYGSDVCWSNTNYKVIKDDKDQYLIHCILNDNYTGLTGTNGKLNEDPKNFFINHTSYTEPNSFNKIRTLFTKTYFAKQHNANRITQFDAEALDAALKEVIKLIEK